MYVVAWRGQSHLHLENTYDAVLATPKWVPLIEIDTRLTSDGAMVAYHSPTMRVHGDPRQVDEIPLHEIQAKEIEYRRRSYQIPEVIDLFETGRDFMFHVKRETVIADYVAKVDQFPRAAFFHSNSDAHLQALVGHRNVLGLFKSIYRVPEDMQVLPFVHGYMLGHRAFTKDSSALEDRWLSKLRRARKHLVVFAGATERWMRELVEYDVDAFLTSRFDRAERVVGELGYGKDDISSELSLHLPLTSGLA